MQTHSTPTNPLGTPPLRIVRCVSWCAVSSEAQAKDDKESLPDQRARNRAFIDELAHHYPGVTGELVAELEVVGSRSIILLEEAKQRHPAYAQLVSLLERRAVDAIILRDTSRLGRELALTAAVQGLARRAGCIVIPREGARPSFDGEGNNVFVSAIEGAEAQQYVARLKQYRRIGMTGRVERAKRFPVKPPYGYRALYREGDRHPYGYVLHEEQAAVVRRIFDLHLSDVGAYTIAEQLNAAGVPTPSAARWPAEGRTPKPGWTHIMVATIIYRAPVYAGFLTFNRRSKTGQQAILVEGQHPAILTREELDAVQARRREHATTPRTRLYSGSTYCAECGKRMNGSARYTPLPEGGERREDTMKCHRCGTMIAERFLADALTAALDVLERTDDATLAAAVSQSDAAHDAARAAEEGGVLERLAQLDARRGWLVTQLGAMRLTEDEFDREEKKRRAEVQRAEADLCRVQQAQATEQDAARRGERIQEVRQSARALLAKAAEHPDLVRPWLTRHVRLSVGKGYGVKRVTVEWV